FVGRVQNGRRTSAKMIHSSIAIQRLGQKPQFYFPVDHRGRPRSFIKSPGARTYFWLSDGVRTKQNLCLFMQRVNWINNSAWGFKCVGSWLAMVTNPDAAPASWKISTRKLPFTRLPNGQDVVWGSELLHTGGEVYIYGYSNRSDSTAIKNQILARAPETALDSPETWEFYSNGAWTGDFSKTTPLFSDAGAEGSVSWQPFLKRFVFVYSDGISGGIVMRVAGTPQGPWSQPAKLYQCPDAKISPHVFCYAAKGHPELSNRDQLLISYAANSDRLSEVLNDSRLYWPRFIRVTFSHRTARPQYSAGLGKRPK
ncbi:MAG: DUF4185 domain-containing protein, partial [Limisphaerales bacterium]